MSRPSGMRKLGDVLDDAGKLAAVAASVDEACDVFVEVLVQPKKVDGQVQYTKVEAGRRACDVWKDAYDRAAASGVG